MQGLSWLSRMTSGHDDKPEPKSRILALSAPWQDFCADLLSFLPTGGSNLVVV